MVAVSAVILTKNEEENIGECLRKLAFCDEVIVLDDYSEDQTIKIAKSLGAKVFQRSINGDFASQRNFGLGKVHNDWVLFIDADERVSPSLRNEISSFQVSISSAVNGFYLRRVDMVWGRELHHGEMSSIKLIRLARKDAGVWRRKVHEYWDICEHLQTLNNPLLHYPHKNILDFFNKINFYSTLHAQQKLDENQRSDIGKILLWPLLKFVQNWIFKLGFLDGTPGLIVAIMMSLHSFLAWSKLWLLVVKNKTLH